MNAITPDRNAPGDPAEAAAIATGDRRDEVHYEPDPDQLLVARHLVRPTGPLPPDATPSTPVVEADAPPIEDVLVAPDGPSVWDARPLPEDADKSGNSPLR